MTSAPSHRHQLESFIRTRVGSRVSWLEERSAWPRAAVAMAQGSALATFRWRGVRVNGSVRIFGIRPLLEEPFFSLSALEKQGFHIDTKQYVVTVPADASAGHYWIAELVSSEKIVVCACRRVLPDRWCVLEENLLEKSSGAVCTSTPSSHRS